MQFKNILPLVALASAAPVLNPRDLVITTVTDVVIETFTSYTTVWVTDGKPPTSATSPVEAGTATATSAVAPSNNAALQISRHHSHSHAASSTALTTTTSAADIPVPTSTLTTPEPVPTTSTTQQVPAPVPTTTTTPIVATTSTTSSISQPTTPASGTFSVETLVGASVPDGPCTSDQTCSGDITHFNPSMGLGACGYKDWAAKTIWQDTDYVVAVSSNIMGTFTNAGVEGSVNTLCNRSVKIKAQAGGQDVTARVVDRCPTCPGNFDLDLSPAVFDLVAPQGDGRVHDVEWYWV